SPSASRADVERVITQFFERSKAHGVDRRFGHADACAIGSTEAKQLLGAAGRKAAPARAAPFPAGDGVAGMCVRRPHAAMRTLPKPAMGNNTGDDAIGDVPFVGQITPGRGAGPRSKAMSPTDRDGPNRLRLGRTLPDRCPRHEADDISDTIVRVGEAAGTEVLGERKHVPFCGRQRIEPTAAIMDNNHDLAVASIFERAAGAFLDVDFPAFFFEQGRAADLFAQPFDFFLVHLLSPGSPQATSGPFLGWSRLFQALWNIPDRPRSLPDARAR